MAENETIAEIKRLRARVKSLEEKAAKTDELEARIVELKEKLEVEKTERDFVDWDEEE